MPNDPSEVFFPHATELPDFIRHDIEYPAPQKSPADTPARCYHIQVGYISRLVALCDYFAHSDGFSGSLEERERAAQWFTELQLIFLSGNLDCGNEFDMQFRQNPDNTCQLQWRQNDGEAWQLMFDYGLCFANVLTGNGMVDNITLTVMQQQSQTLNVDYDGTIASIAPNMVYDSSPRDAFRDLAMCVWLAQALAEIAELAGTYQSRYSGWFWDTYRFIHDLVGDVVPFIVFGLQLAGLLPVSWFIYVAFAVGVALNEAIGQAIEEYDLTPFNDEGLILQALCVARANLAGDDVSEAEFNDAFNGADLIPGMNTDSYNVLVALVNNHTAYLNFLDATSQIVLQLEDGYLEYACPCDTWEKSWDFALTDGDWSLSVHGNLWTDPDPAPRGEWVDGEGWETRILETDRRHLNIHIPTSSHFQCVGLEVDLEHPAGVRLSYQCTLGVGLNEYADPKVIDTNPAHTHLQWDGFPTEANCVLLEMSFNGNVNSRAVSVRVRGIGTQPSWLP